MHSHAFKHDCYNEISDALGDFASDFDIASIVDKVYMYDSAKSLFVVCELYLGDSQDSIDAFWDVARAFDVSY